MLVVVLLADLNACAEVQQCKEGEKQRFRIAQWILYIKHDLLCYISPGTSQQLTGTLQVKNESRYRTLFSLE